MNNNAQMFKCHKSQMGVICMKSWKHCALLVMTTTKWFCGNSCTCAHDVLLHIDVNDEPKSAPCTTLVQLFLNILLMIYGSYTVRKKRVILFFAYGHWKEAHTYLLLQVSSVPLLVLQTYELYIIQIQIWDASKIYRNYWKILKKIK